MSDYYDRDGNPITYDQWFGLRLNTDFETLKRVDKTDLPGDVWVSTVFLGMNHQYGDGPPLIFETMIFGGPLDGDQWRYSTEEEALVGHEEACRLALAADTETGSEETE